MTSTTSSSISSASKSQSLLPAALPKSNIPSKKTSKDSKNEKSLETTVEKLTQNRNKEISGKSETTSSVKIDSVEKEKPKRLESPERHKDNRTVTGKAEPKEEKREAGGNTSSPLPPPVSSSSSVTVPTSVSSDVCPEKGKTGKEAEVAKPNETPEAVPSQGEKVGAGVESKDGVKKSPCADSSKETESGSNSVRSKDLSNNVDIVKQGEEVVEGGK